MLAISIRGLRAWAEGEPPANVAERPNIVRSIHAIVQPALHATAWPRWLLLERAFLDASATGDLLFAALTLRTMCEEVQRLRALDLEADGLAFLAASGTAVDQERLRLFLTLAWTSLDNLPPDMVIDGEKWPSLKLMKEAMPRVERARGNLNSYVHPNYGSHIVALFPERASAAQLLLEAVVAIYEAFFALSWSEHPPARQAVPVGIGALETWPRMVRRLQSHILPQLRRSAGNPASAKVEVPALIEHLTMERADLVTLLSDPDLAPLLKELPRRASRAASGDESSRYRMWDGAKAINILDFASARNAERLLAEEFPFGAPDAIDQTRWLRFNALSLQLAILLDEVKAAAFKAQLTRQITQGNSLGTLLCVRSLIEHRALVVWLTRQVGIGLDTLAAELEAARPLPESTTKIEQPLAKRRAVSGPRGTDRIDPRRYGG